jgi:hypothetical protein
MVLHVDNKVELGGPKQWNQRWRGERLALNVAGALQSARDSRVSHARTATHPTFPACLDPLLTARTLLPNSRLRPTFQRFLSHILNSTQTANMPSGQGGKFAVPRSHRSRGQRLEPC